MVPVFAGCIDPDPQALERAHRTLIRACAYLDAGRWRSGGGEDLLGDDRHVRFIGNALRELDRFLSLLTDRAAAELRMGRRAAFARRSNAPNKLRSVRRRMNRPCPDREWLQGIGRMRDCLHHRAGLTGGARLTLAPDALSRLCDGYAAIADALMGEVYAASASSA